MKKFNLKRFDPTKKVVHNTERPFGHLNDNQLFELDKIVMAGFNKQKANGTLNQKAMNNFVAKMEAEKNRRS